MTAAEDGACHEALRDQAHQPRARARARGDRALAARRERGGVRHPLSRARRSAQRPARGPVAALGARPRHARGARRPPHLVRPVRGVVRQDAAGQFRQLDPHRPAGAAGAGARRRQHARPHARLARAHAAPRGADRGSRGRARRDRRQHRGDPGRVRPLGAAGVLVRLHRGLRLHPSVRHVPADLGNGDQAGARVAVFPRADLRARDGERNALRDDPPPARGAVAGAGRGLHPHRARQGRAGVAPRVQGGFPDSGHRDHERQDPVPARRRGDRRAGVQLARHGAHGVAGGAGPLLPGHYGHCACGGSVRAPGQPAAAGRLHRRQPARFERIGATVGVRRYVQTPGPIGEFSELPLWQRAETVDLVYVGYGLLVVALVLASYLLGAFGWLPDDPQRMNVELLAITISVVGGSVLGILAGYRGGWFDTIITYFDNLLDSFPRLVLILLVIAAFKPDIYYVMVVVGITGMPVIANLIAGKIAFLRQKSFIEAAHALGLPAHTVILKHILWLNCRALLVIQATLGMAEAILVETSLSYLGFGVQEPTPSWGNMVQAGANYFLQGKFWPSTAPALAILATILGFQLLGDGLNNLLEGKRRR